MPQLLTTKSGRQTKTPPPCGRTVDYNLPKSPWQKLVDSTRAKRKISTRELARLLKVSHSTMWIWLHNTNGYPGTRSFRESHLKALARHLSLDFDELRVALDASRHLYTPQTASPAPSQDAFRDFITVIENDKRTHLRRTWVLNLAKRLAGDSPSIES